MQGKGVVQHINIGEVHADNPAELAKLERTLKKASDWTALGFGG